MPIQLIITLEPGQPQTVTGPLENKNLCYHMLLDALLAIIAYEPKKILPVGVLLFDPTKIPPGAGKPMG